MGDALLVLVIMLGIVTAGGGVGELVVAVVVAVVVMVFINHDGGLLLDDDRVSLDHDGAIDDHFVAPLDDDGTSHAHIDDGTLNHHLRRRISDGGGTNANGAAGDDQADRHY